jgi:hypothetical protein
MLLISLALAEMGLPGLLPVPPSHPGSRVLSGAASGLAAANGVMVFPRLRLKVTELRGPKTAGVLNLKL